MSESLARFTIPLVTFSKSVINGDRLNGESNNAEPRTHIFFNLTVVDDDVHVVVNVDVLDVPIGVSVKESHGKTCSTLHRENAADIPVVVVAVEDVFF